MVSDPSFMSSAGFEFSGVRERISEIREELVDLQARLCGSAMPRELSRWLSRKFLAFREKICCPSKLGPLVFKGNPHLEQFSCGFPVKLQIQPAHTI